LNSGPHGEVYTIDADGQHLKNITDNHCDSGSADPVWFPYGTKILFLSAHSFESGFGIGPATMNPDGTDRHFISSDPQEMHRPDGESVPQSQAYDKGKESRGRALGSPLSPIHRRADLFNSSHKLGGLQPLSF
jgi:Tol biopolymer transport system component